ncbi:MAG TPA: hypothetical protein HA252_06500 [Candidatus Diapherotrites archaeon]|nr:hypothetical protein [Candidatus Diapherotrites archaeon]
MDSLKGLLGKKKTVQPPGPTATPPAPPTVTEGQQKATEERLKREAAKRIWAETQERLAKAEVEENALNPETAAEEIAEQMEHARGRMKRFPSLDALDKPRAPGKAEATEENLPRRLRRRR